jgi:hypothetical protein
MSLISPLHYATVGDLAEINNINVFAVIETLSYAIFTSAQLFGAVPQAFTLKYTSFCS